MGVDIELVGSSQYPVLSLVDSTGQILGCH